jgi:hypothetical protein
MSSDTIYGNLLYNFITFSAINYKKIGIVKSGSVQIVFSTNRFVITSGDCSNTLSKLFI